MAETGIAKEALRRGDVFVRNDQPARQYAERAVEHAHVAVEYHVADAGAVEQRADRRHQHRIVCPDEFAHGFRALYSRAHGNIPCVGALARPA